MNDEELQYISTDLFRIRMRLEELTNDIYDLEKLIDDRPYDDEEYL